MNTAQNLFDNPQNSNSYKGKSQKDFTYNPYIVLS